jgi:Plasmid stability protein
MASLLIKNLPEDLHYRLKIRARQHHRSVNKEVIALLETALAQPSLEELPAPVRLSKPLTQEILDQAREEGRA